jgi:hypothetical protein
MKPLLPVALFALTCLLPPTHALDASTASVASVAPTAAAASAASSAGTPQESGWFDTAELGFVTTGGNSDTTTLSFRNVLRRL